MADQSHTTNPTTTNPDDAALVRHAEAVQRFIDEINAGKHEDPDKPGSVSPEATERQVQMEVELMRMPVGGGAGLVVKLEKAFEKLVGSLETDLAKHYGIISGQLYLHTALADAKRLADHGGDDDAPAWWAPANLMDIVGDARGFHEIADAAVIYLDKGPWKELEKNRMSVAEDLMDSLFAFMAFQPARNWNDALAQALALGYVGEKLAGQVQMTETESAFVGEQIVSMAYSLARHIEEETDASRDESAFGYCMPRRCDPFDRTGYEATAD